MDRNAFTDRILSCQDGPDASGPVEQPIGRSASPLIIVDENRSENVQWLSPLVLEDGFGVEFRDDHIHVLLGKDFKVDPTRRDEFWAMIRDVCQRHNSRRVLVEGYVPEGERETSDVIDAGQKTAVVPRLWLAFAFSGFEPTEQSELYEVIAASRGVRVKFFSTPERALTWLRHNAPQ